MRKYSEMLKDCSDSVVEREITAYKNKLEIMVNTEEQKASYNKRIALAHAELASRAQRRRIPAVAIETVTARSEGDFMFNSTSEAIEFERLLVAKFPPVGYGTTSRRVNDTQVHFYVGSCE